MSASSSRIRSLGPEGDVYDSRSYSGTVLDLDPLAPETLRPLRREEYDRMVEVGLFEDERIELLRGMLVTMTPPGSEHSEAVRRLNELLVLDLHERARISPQCPFAALDDSQPEPDLAVLPRQDHSKAHPSSAFLVVEVAMSSLRKDRRVKTSIYAENGVPEYWIVNLVAGQIEVHCNPEDGRYKGLVTYDRGQAIRLQAFPDVEISVDSVLPSE